MNKFASKIKKLLRLLLKYLKLLSVFIAIALIASIGYFLYKNLYLTIISAKEIIVLQKDISLGRIRMDILETVENNLQNKLAIPEIGESTEKQIFETNDTVNEININTNSNNEELNDDEFTPDPKTSF